MGRVGLCIAAAAPACDALVCVAGALAARGGPREAVGWTPQGPVLLGAARLGWLALLAGTSLLQGSDRLQRVLARVETVLEVSFPYVFFVLLAALGLTHLVTDKPQRVSDGDVAWFWAVGVASAALVAAETWCTLEALTPLRAWLQRRRDARAAGAGAEGSSQRLDTELLSVEGGEAVGAAPARRGGQASGRTEQEEEEQRKKEKEDAERRPTIRKLLMLVRPDWPLVIQACVLLICAAVSEVLIPHFIGETVSVIITAGEKGTLASRPFKGPVVKLLIAAACCSVFSACRGATFILLGSRASVRLRQRLFDSLAKQDISFFDSSKTGELTSRMTQDCQKVADQVTLNVNVFLRTMVQIVTTLVFMFHLSAQLTWVAFVSVPAIIAISKKYGKVMQTLSKESQKALAEANAVAEECLSSMPTVRSFAAEPFESQRFGDKLGDYYKLMRRQAAFYIVYLSLTLMLPNGVAALVLFYGGKLAMEGHPTSVLLSFVLYLQTLNSAFSTLGDFYSSMVQALGAATRVFELIGQVPELALDPPEGGAVDSPGRGAVRLEDVRFSYEKGPGTDVLRGLTLDVPAGNVVALVGPSGNGKTTVIALLKRLYRAREGRVTIDGEDVWNFKHREYHRVVSIVGQEPVLFARTIRENILFGLENPGQPSQADDEAVFKATKRANAHDFIVGMTKGYDADISQRGVKLSGGQKQRIAIARALVRRPKVLLLDEATSALDAESERQVQSAIDTMISEGQVTVILIAHRLSTVKNSHKICVVQGGKVVEEGPHDELIAKGSAYFKLVQCQLSAAPAQHSHLDGEHFAEASDSATGA